MKQLINRSALWYLAAFAIPIAIVLLTYLSLGVYPFGENTISHWDMRITYTYFYEWLKNVLEHGGNVFYSFSKSLGGNMFAGFATICASPLNLLIVLFPGKNPMPFMTFVTVLRFGLAGVTSLYYIRHRFSIHEGFSLALSMCYALMLFMTTEYLNPLWIDAVVILPFIMLGVYRLVTSGRTTLLFVSLWFNIMIDWYNGYMACLFVIILYLFECFLYAPAAKTEGKIVRLGFMVHPGRFSATFTLAVLSSLAFLLPTALGLLGGKGAVPSNLFSPNIHYYFPEVIRSFFFGVYEKELIPQLYSGTLTLVCVVWFAANPNIGTREKIATLSLLSFLVFCTWFAPLDRIWCGLRDGTSYYCRWSYIITAMLIFTAARCLENTQPIKNTKTGLICGSVVLAIIAAIIFRSKHYADVQTLAFSLLFIVATSIILLLWSQNEGKKAWRVSLATVLIILLCGELFLNNHLTVSFSLPHPEHSSISRYESYFSEGERQYGEMNSQDETDLNDYRVTKLYTFLTGNEEVMTNEGFVYGYSQIAQYDSCYDDNVQNLMSSFGYSSEWICMTTYYNPVLPADSLLGVRYTSAATCPPGYTDPGFSKTQDGNRFFENPYALPLGFIADASIAEQTIPTTTDDDPNKNPFEYQNSFFKLLASSDKACYKEVEVNLVSNTPSGKTWSVNLPDNAITYGYFAGNPNTNLHALANDSAEIARLDKWSHGIFPIESANSQGNVQITLCPIEGQSFTGDITNSDIRLLVYSLDMQAFEDMRKTLSTSPFELESFEDGYVKGSCHAPKDGMLFTTIPYDRGWTVKVNGHAVEPFAAQDALMVIPVEEGDNTIELSYISPGFIPGAIISALSIAAYIAFFITVRRRETGRA